MGFEEERFEDRLTDLIKDSEESQNAIASKLGVSSATLSNYKSGKKDASISKLCLIADYFGVTTDFLLGRSINKTNENDAIGRELGLSDETIDILREDEKIFDSSKITPDYYSVANIINLLVNQVRFPELCKRFSDLRGRIEFNPLINDCIPSASKIEKEEFNRKWIELKKSALGNGIKVDLLHGDKEILRHKYNEVFDLLSLILKEISLCTDDVLFDSNNEN